MAAAPGDAALAAAAGGDTAAAAAAGAALAAAAAAVGEAAGEAEICSCLRLRLRSRLIAWDSSCHALSSGFDSSRNLSSPTKQICKGTGGATCEGVGRQREELRLHDQWAVSCLRNSRASQHRQAAAEHRPAWWVHTSPTCLPPWRLEAHTSWPSGSCRMTTCTEALPGVSSETSGVCTLYLRLSTSSCCAAGWVGWARGAAVGQHAHVIAQ